MVDDLDRDPPRLGLLEGPRCIAIERCPRLRVDFRLEAGLEGAVGVAGAEEVSLADKEALLIVVRIDEPAAI